MKPKPIMMTASSVRGILEGRKTQSRRLVNMSRRVDMYCEGDINDPADFGNPAMWFTGLFDDSDDMPIMLNQWPKYSASRSYKVGDLLYVKETWDSLQADRWQVKDGRKPQEGDTIHYQADPGSAWQWRQEWGFWRSPMYMPQWASRITLPVTSVRIERLQDISEADAIAEGIYKSEAELQKPFGVEKFQRWFHDDCGEWGFDTAIAAYAALWDSLHAKGKKPAPWASSPWVFVYDFSILEIKK
jgi:hypothetical protein